MTKKTSSEYDNWKKDIESQKEKLESSIKRVNKQLNTSKLASKKSLESNDLKEEKKKELDKYLSDYDQWNLLKAQKKSLETLLTQAEKDKNSNNADIRFLEFKKENTQGQKFLKEILTQLGITNDKQVANYIKQAKKFNSFEAGVNAVLNILLPEKNASKLSGSSTQVTPDRNIDTDVLHKLCKEQDKKNSNKVSAPAYLSSTLATEVFWKNDSGKSGWNFLKNLFVQVTGRDKQRFVRIPIYPHITLGKNTANKNIADRLRNSVGHYTTLVIDLEKTCCYYFDSMGKNSYYHKLVQPMLTRLKGNSIKVLDLTPEKQVQKSGANSCASWYLRVSEEICKNPDKQIDIQTVYSDENKKKVEENHTSLLNQISKTTPEKKKEGENANQKKEVQALSDDHTNALIKSLLLIFPEEEKINIESFIGTLNKKHPDVLLMLGKDAAWYVCKALYPLQMARQKITFEQLVSIDNDLKKVKDAILSPKTSNPLYDLSTSRLQKMYEFIIKANITRPTPSNTKKVLYLKRREDFSEIVKSDITNWERAKSILKNYKDNDPFVILFKKKITEIQKNNTSLISKAIWTDEKIIISALSLLKNDLLFWQILNKYLLENPLKRQHFEKEIKEAKRLKKEGIFVKHNVNSIKIKTGLSDQEKIELKWFNIMIMNKVYLSFFKKAEKEKLSFERKIGDRIIQSYIYRTLPDVSEYKFWWISCKPTFKNLNPKNVQPWQILSDELVNLPYEGQIDSLLGKDGYTPEIKGTLAETLEGIDRDKVWAFRPNHGLTHSIRQRLYLQQYFKIIKEHGKEEYRSLQLTAEEKACAELAAFLYRCGRVNESSGSVQPDHGHRSRAIFQQVAVLLGFDKTLAQCIGEGIDNYEELKDKNYTPQYNGYKSDNKKEEEKKKEQKRKARLIKNLLKAAHGTDLVRCKKEHYELASHHVEHYLQPLIDEAEINIHSVTDAFLEYAREANAATGNKVILPSSNFGLIPYDPELYALCAENVDACLLFLQQNIKLRKFTAVDKLITRNLDAKDIIKKQPGVSFAQGTYPSRGVLSPYRDDRGQIIARGSYTIETVRDKNQKKIECIRINACQFYSDNIQDYKSLLEDKKKKKGTASDNKDKLKSLTEYYKQLGAGVGWYRDIHQLEDGCILWCSGSNPSAGAFVAAGRMRRAGLWASKYRIEHSSLYNPTAYLNLQFDEEKGALFTASKKLMKLLETAQKVMSILAGKAQELLKNPEMIDSLPDKTSKLAEACSKFNDFIEKTNEFIQKHHIEDLVLKKDDLNKKNTLKSDLETKLKTFLNTVETKYTPRPTKIDEAKNNIALVDAAEDYLQVKRLISIMKHCEKRLSGLKKLSEPKALQSSQDGNKIITSIGQILEAYYGEKKKEEVNKFDVSDKKSYEIIFSDITKNNTKEQFEKTIENTKNKKNDPRWRLQNPRIVSFLIPVDIFEDQVSKAVIEGGKSKYDYVAIVDKRFEPNQFGLENRTLMNLKSHMIKNSLETYYYNKELIDPTDKKQEKTHGKALSIADMAKAIGQAEQRDVFDRIWTAGKGFAAQGGVNLDARAQELATCNDTWQVLLKPELAPNLFRDDKKPIQNRVVYLMQLLAEVLQVKIEEIQKALSGIFSDDNKKWPLLSKRYIQFEDTQKQNKQETALQRQDRLTNELRSVVNAIQLRKQYPDAKKSPKEVEDKIKTAQLFLKTTFNEKGDPSITEKKQMEVLILNTMRQVQLNATEARIQYTIMDNRMTRVDANGQVADTDIGTLPYIQDFTTNNTKQEKKRLKQIAEKLKKLDSKATTKDRINCLMQNDPELNYRYWKPSNDQKRSMMIDHVDTIIKALPNKKDNKDLHSKLLIAMLFHDMERRESIVRAESAHRSKPQNLTLDIMKRYAPLIQTVCGLKDTDTLLLQILFTAVADNPLAALPKDNLTEENIPLVIFKKGLSLGIKKEDVTNMQNLFETCIDVCLAMANIAGKTLSGIKKEDIKKDITKEAIKKYLETQEKKDTDLVKNWKEINIKKTQKPLEKEQQQKEEQEKKKQEKEEQEKKNETPLIANKVHNKIDIIDHLLKKTSCKQEELAEAFDLISYNDFRNMDSSVVDLLKRLDPLDRVKLEKLFTQPDKKLTLTEEQKLHFSKLRQGRGQRLLEALRSANMLLNNVGKETITLLKDELYYAIKRELAHIQFLRQAMAKIKGVNLTSLYDKRKPRIVQKGLKNKSGENFSKKYKSFKQNQKKATPSKDLYKTYKEKLETQSETKANQKALKQQNKKYENILKETLLESQTDWGAYKEKNKDIIETLINEKSFTELYRKPQVKALLKMLLPQLKGNNDKNKTKFQTIALKNKDHKNICWFNAGLQFLYTLLNISGSLAGGQSNIKANEKDWDTLRLDLSKTYPFLQKDKQNDSSEFIGYALELLDDLRNTTTIKIANKITWKKNTDKKNFTSSTPENILTLPTANKNKSVQDCVDSYFNTKSKLDDYKPDGNNKVNGATQQLIIDEFQTLPQMLLLSLKRFTYDKNKKSLSKTKTDITHSDTITLTIRGEKVTYSLQAIVCHNGDTPNSGHYVTYRKESKGKNWVLYDDLKKKPEQVKEDTIPKDQGYLYLYKKEEKKAIKKNEKENKK